MQCIQQNWLSLLKPLAVQGPVLGRRVLPDCGNGKEGWQNYLSVLGSETSKDVLISCASDHQSAGHSARLCSQTSGVVTTVELWSCSAFVIHLLVTINFQKIHGIGMHWLPMLRIQSCRLYLVGL